MGALPRRRSDNNDIDIFFTNITPVSGVVIEDLEGERVTQDRGAGRRDTNRKRGGGGAIIRPRAPCQNHISNMGSNGVLLKMSPAKK